MKLVTNKPHQEIAVEDCTDGKVYVMKHYEVWYMLRSTAYKSGYYRWVALDNSFTKGNALGKSSGYPLEFCLKYDNTIYQFDTMREAMLFVFGEKEVNHD